MSDSALGRRTVLKRAAAVAAAGGPVVVGLGYANTRPSRAVTARAVDEFVAADVSLDRNDGQLDEVTVAPELEVTWRDFGGGLESIDVTLSAAIEGEPGFDVLFEGPVDDDAVTADGTFESVDGTVTLAFDRLDLTAVGDAVTVADFGESLDPGDVETTTVELVLRVDVEGRQREVETAIETVTFDVTLSNPEGTATTTGRANTDAG